MNSRKMSYVVAGSAIGGAVGYFLLTDSGRKAARAIRNFDPNTIPEKAENLREVIERRGQQVSRKIETVRDKIMESIEAGKQAYNSEDNGFQSQLRRVESHNSNITANVHKTVDDLNKSVYTFEKSVLEPVYQLGAMARAFQRGVNSLMQGEHSEKRNDAYGFDRQNVTGIR